MTIEVLEAEKICDGFVFGEGIRWAGDSIIMSDMLGCRVVKIDPDSGSTKTLLELETQPNGLICLEDGAILVTSMFDGKILKLGPDGVTEEVADISDVMTGYLGDIVMSEGGSLYVDDVGSRVLHGELPGKNGRLIHITPDGVVSVCLENLGFPNGVTIAPDGKTLFLVESMADVSTRTTVIKAYNIDANGNLEAGETIIESPGTAFDGMGMDAEGGLWPCVPMQNEVWRVDRSGEITHRISMPGVEPIACAIGGVDGLTMYITASEYSEDNLFNAMMARTIRSSVWRVEVPFSKGGARP